MAPREEIGQHTQRERHGRHGRPKPFGGRLRLPTLRFSGAAMAMSTVVGISIATTWLLHEQQGVGRRAGVARVGSSPPPTPGSDRADLASAPDTARASTPPAPSGRPTVRPSGPTASDSHVSYPPVSGVPAPRPPATGTTLPLAEGRSVDRGPVDAPTPGAVVPSSPQDGPWTTAERPPANRPPYQQPGLPDSAVPPAPSPSPARPFAPELRPTGAPTDDWTTARPGTSEPPPTPALPGGRDDDGTDPDPDGTVDDALTGSALVQPLGRDGTRHVLTLTVTEPLTALQAELRLAPGEPAPDGVDATAWTDLAGAVVTTLHERGTLVCRFTTPAGTDVPPGRYTFGVRSGLPATAPATGAPASAAPSASAPSPFAPAPAAPRPGESTPDGPRKAAPAESWSASAFGIHRPRAVAALGTFAAPAS
ncbi:hypothetical protein [Kitasatospora sp. NPDC059327]|uniref:hypothetical protein n=1 Tax=Kitasatospora sp. NPDC059327 TaxID=3346803 RepID=UPI00368A28E6